MWFCFFGFVDEGEIDFVCFWVSDEMVICEYDIFGGKVVCFYDVFVGLLFYVFV